MKTTLYKHLLLIAGTLITGLAMAQSSGNFVVPIKEIQKKQLTDNFTAREIKKKELQIAPSRIILLNLVANRQTQDEKNRKKLRR
jgi:hypothetical protein